MGLFPLLYTAWVSVHDWNLIGGQGDFVGLKNFATVLAQPYFWTSCATPSASSYSSVPQVLAAIAIAAVLDFNLRGKTFGAWVCCSPTSWHRSPSHSSSMTSSATGTASSTAGS
jgi:ABC-type sugar transport system permease subunit